MELCTTCGNHTASDITGTFYCIVCGSKQRAINMVPWNQEAASLDDGSHVFKGIFAKLSTDAGTVGSAIQLAETAREATLDPLTQERSMLTGNRHRCSS